MKKVYFFALTAISIFSVANIKTSDNNKAKVNQNSIQTSTSTKTSEPQKIGPMDIQAGSNASMIWTKDAMGNDYIYTWGDNSKGQLGIGSVDTSKHQEWQLINYQFPILNDGGHVKAISMNFYNAAVVITDSEGLDHIYIWGDNTYGQLGNGELGNTEEYSAPIDITNSFNADYPNGFLVNEIKLSLKNSGVILEDPLTHETSLYMWGDNTFGQIGSGAISSTPSPTPTKVNIPLSNDEKVENLAIGYDGASVVVTNTSGELTNDKLYVWGQSNYGGLGINIGNTSGVPTLIDKSTTLDLSTSSTDTSNGGHSKSEYLPYTYKINDVEMGYDNIAVVLENNIGQTFLFTAGDNTSGGRATPESIGGDINWYDASRYMNTGFDGNNKILELDSSYNETKRASTMGASVQNVSSDTNELYTWGYNDNDNINGGNSASIWTPTLVDYPIFLNNEIVNFAMGENHTIITLEQKIETEDDNSLIGKSRIISFGSDSSGQLGVVGFNNSNTVNDHYVEKENILPTISDFKIDQNSITVDSFEFSVKINDPYDYVNPEYMNLFATDNITNTSNKLNTELIDTQIEPITKIETATYSVSNLNSNASYTDFVVNFGISGIADLVNSDEITTLSNAPILKDSSVTYIDKHSISFLISIEDQYAVFDPNDPNTKVTLVDEYGNEYLASYVGISDSNTKDANYITNYEYQVNDLKSGTSYTFTELQIQYDQYETHDIVYSASSYQFKTVNSYFYLTVAIILFLIIAIVIVAIILYGFKIKRNRKIETEMENAFDNFGEQVAIDSFGGSFGEPQPIGTQMGNTIGETFSENANE